MTAAAYEHVSFIFHTSLGRAMFSLMCGFRLFMLGLFYTTQMYMLVSNTGIVDTVLNGCAIAFLTELDDLVNCSGRKSM